MLKLIIVLFFITGCAKYSAEDFALAFLQAKAASGNTQKSFDRGLGSQYPNQQTVNQQNLFIKEGIDNYNRNDYLYGAGAIK